MAGASVRASLEASRTALVEDLIGRYPHIPPEAVLKEDLLRSGMAFDHSALTDNLDGEVKPKSYFIFSFDQEAAAQLGEAAIRRPPEELALTGGPLPPSPHDRVGSGQPRLALPRFRVTMARCELSLDGRLMADVLLPPMPEYYRHELTNGKTVMETAPTIQWGYLIYLTALRLCQYFGAKEECQFCDINHNWRQHKQEGRPYTGIKSVDDVLEALAIIDRYDTGAVSKAYTLTGGSVTSKVDGLAEADFYGRYAQAIEERFPNRWIGKVVAQALPQGRRPALQGLRHQDLPPQLRGVGRAPVRDHLPGQDPLRRPRRVAPPDPGRRRRVRPALRDPQLRGRRGDGKAVWVHVRRRGDREHHRGTRLLHEPRGDAALHHLVPRAGDSAGARQPQGAPLEYHIRLLETYRATLESTASSRRRATAWPEPVTRCSRSARSWTHFARKKFRSKKAVPTLTP